MGIVLRWYLAPTLIGTRGFVTMPDSAAP
jgi:hypothetical protein